MRSGVILLGAAIYLVSLAGQAATGSVEMRLRALESRLPDADRLAAIERNLGTQGAGMLATELEQLKGEVSELRGMIEQLTHELKKQQQGQQQLYGDIDRRLQSLEARLGAGAGAAPATNEPGPAADAAEPAGVATAGNEQAEYLAAFDLLQGGKTQDAITAFQRFLENHPDGSYATNATYWLGEAYYVNKNFPEATGEFEKLLAQHPDSPKASGALLKLGYIHYDTRSYARARQLLEEVKQRYPNSNVATLAAERLERMRKEGV